MKYKKIAREFDAIQFTGDNHADCVRFIGPDAMDNRLNYPNVRTITGTIRVLPGDFIYYITAQVLNVLDEKTFLQTYEMA